jgi:hypothetical protein
VPRLSLPHRFRRVVNLVNGSSIAGLAIARLGSATVSSGPEGLWLAEGYRLPFPVAGAFTVGKVLITPTSFDQLRTWSPHVLEHEARHAWQYVCCGCSSSRLYLVAMGGRWSDRPRGPQRVRAVGQAAADGGYVDVPVRPFTAEVRKLFRYAGRRAPDRSSDLGQP